MNRLNGSNGSRGGLARDLGARMQRIIHPESLRQLEQVGQLPPATQIRPTDREAYLARALILLVCRSAGISRDLLERAFEIDKATFWAAVYENLKAGKK